MDRVQAVRRMQSYLEEHYLEDVSMKELAQVAYYSPWYSYRLFIKFVHYSPSEYVRKYRLSKSIHDLVDEKSNLTEIAIKYGYNSVDGYRRAFYREFGINPSKYSKKPYPMELFTSPYVNLESDDTIDNSDNEVVISQIHRCKRKFIYVTCKSANNVFAFYGEIKFNCWGILKSFQSLYGNPVQTYLPKKMVIPGEIGSYAEGVEVDLSFNEPLPENFKLMELEECDYIQFQGRINDSGESSRAVYLVNQAMRNYHPEDHGYCWDDENNPSFQLETNYRDGFRYLKPIKKLLH